MIDEHKKTNDDDDITEEEDNLIYIQTFESGIFANLICNETKISIRAQTSVAQIQI